MKKQKMRTLARKIVTERLDLGAGFPDIDIQDEVIDGDDVQVTVVITVTSLDLEQETDK